MVQWEILHKMAPLETCHLNSSSRGSFLSCGRKSNLDLPTNQDSSGKWVVLRLELPNVKKHVSVVILVVTRNRILGWQVEPKGITGISYPRHSIYGVYLPTWMVNLMVTCRKIYHTLSVWGMWEIVFFNTFNKTCSAMGWFTWMVLRKCQQTPGTYTRPSTTCLWRNSFHIGIFRYQTGIVPGVCWIFFDIYIYIYAEAQAFGSSSWGR